MDVLGLIPARGGSKGIPKKPLALLREKSLLSYTCTEALRATRLTRVILSTNDDQIAQCGRACGVEVPFLRPDELATDETPMLDVLRHALELLEREGYRAEVVVVLQPTSPLRRAEHIDGAVELLQESGVDSVVSVVEVPHQFTPGSLLRLESGRLVPFLDGPQILRRQEKPILYARNGPAVLAVRRHVLLEQGSLFGAVCRPLIMPPEASVDIDTPFDLTVAECLLSSVMSHRDGPDGG